MTCTKCKLIPSIDYFHVDVYISVISESIQLTLIKALKSIKYDFQTLADYLVVYTPNFELFISELNSGEFFEPLESTDIKVLPMTKGAFPTFSDFKNTHSLSYWTALLESQDIIHVLKNQALKTVFQPILNTQDLSLFGYEGLSRGIRPDGRLISPLALFSSAKKLDLLFNLDRQCRESTIRSASAKGYTEKLFINFIPTAIYDPKECLQSTVQVISDCHIKPDQIVFEVVETEQVADYSHLKKILHYYHNQGFQTALDDVGSGFSTLEAYHALGTDYIKLDMSLIRDIHLNPLNQALVSRILSLKSSCQVKILAEGIETEAEYQYLKTLGVDYVQGYYFGKPK